jgi:GT2 family glycosyltransferase
VQPVAGKFPSIAGEIFDLLRLSRFLDRKGRARRYLGTEADYSRQFQCDWVWGTFFMFRKADLIHFPAQKLQEDFFMYYEDVQWCYHFRKRVKKKIICSPGPKVLHHIGGSDTGGDQDRKYYTRILPNEYSWMKAIKGWLYVKVYYLVKAMHFYSTGSEENAVKAGYFAKLVLKGVD